MQPPFKALAMATVVKSCHIQTQPYKGLKITRGLIGEISQYGFDILSFQQQSEVPSTFPNGKYDQI